MVYIMYTCMVKVSKQNQNQKQIEATQPIQISQRFSVPAIDLPFNFNKEDTTWKDKYGITSVPLLVRSANGELYDDKKFKGVFINGNYKRIVGRNYVVLPNEEVESVLKEYIKRTNSGLEIKSKHTSHFGDAAYWVIHSHKLENVKLHDDVMVGCVVRNSIGTYVALGADLYTYRLVCKNGAIAKGQDLGSIAIRHIGKRDDMMLEFGNGIERIIDRTIDLVKLYRKSVNLELNLKIAQELAKRIPQRALPKTVEVDTKSGKVSLTGKQDLWSAFNDVTAAAWHNDKTGFLTKRHIELHAHKVLIQAVAAA